MISRRSLFGVLAAAPVGAVAVVEAAKAAIEAAPVAVRATNPLVLYAGGITWVDPDYDERTGEVLLTEYQPCLPVETVAVVPLSQARFVCSDDGATI